MVSDRVVSGMRSTGRLHLGNYFGALKSWLEIQANHEAFFFVADWHALTTGSQDTEDLRQHRQSIVLDWLAAGLDPDQVTVFVQSEVPEHAELHLLFEMVTPESWLRRNPTYKGAQEELGDEETSSVGFLSYPVLQTADVLAYHGEKVPVGKDQLPHLEIGRKIARRFNHRYDTDLPEMEPILQETPEILGLDGRKMSKSYDNCIYLSDDPETRRDKIMKAQTDTGPEPGDEVPEEGPVANLFRLLELVDAQEKRDQYAEEYRNGSIQYGYLKQDLAEAMNDYFQEFDRRRKELADDPDYVQNILAEGRKQAREVAEKTLGKLREAMNLRPLP